jgi:hypothetical protein
MKALKRFISMFFCQHDWQFLRNIYGDERLYGWAAEEGCPHCGARREAAFRHD